MSKLIPKASKNNSKANIKSVLLQIHLQQYLPVFQRNEIDFTTFLTLNEQSLKSIGVKNESHRKILLIYIRKLQQLLTSATAENNMSLIVENDDGLMKDDSQISVGHVLTPITEEEEPTTEEVNDLQNSNVAVNDSVVGTNDDDQKSQIIPPIPPIISNSSTTDSNNTTSNNHADNDHQNELETQLTSTSVEDDDYIPISLTPRGRKHNSTDDQLILAMRRKRGTAVRDTHWRISAPVTSVLPSYFDVVDRHALRKSVIREEIHEELPPYSCTVHKAGYVFKKNEFVSKGTKARDRSWKHQYLYLWGTLLRIYKSEPVDINRVNPIHEFSMQNAQIGLAADYIKRRNVIRVRVSTGHQFLLHIQTSREDCVTWIEKLQSSVNISSTLDEREMPMFITLPTRRRRVNAPTIISSSSSLTSTSSMNYEGGMGNISLINYSLVPVSSSGLTLQQYNEMARELQQVQITGALPQQQLSW